MMAAKEQTQRGRSPLAICSQLKVASPLFNEGRDEELCWYDVMATTKVKDYHANPKKIISQPVCCSGKAKVLCGFDQCGLSNPISYCGMSN